MGRPKEFDPDHALSRAMELFWERGYQGTSMQDLVEHMGINRGSLYDTFGGKRALFQAALERYCAQYITALVTSLEGPGDARTVLSAALQAEVETLLDPERPHGCLLTSSALELSARDERVRVTVEENLLRIEDALCALLERTGDRGEHRDVARALLAVLQGMVVLARSGRDRETLESVARAALSLLGPRPIART